MTINTITQDRSLTNRTAMSHVDPEREKFVIGMMALFGKERFLYEQWWDSGLSEAIVWKARAALASAELAERNAEIKRLTISGEK